jgi:hypothetical protein
MPRRSIRAPTTRYFNSKRYRAFHRTLNLWGFATINTGPLQGAIWHPLFKRGRLDLLQRIHRVERAVGVKGRPRGKKNPKKQELQQEEELKEQQQHGQASLKGGDDHEDYSSELRRSFGTASATHQGHEPSDRVAASIGSGPAPQGLPSLLRPPTARMDADGPGLTNLQAPDFHLLQHQLAQQQLSNLLGGLPPVGESFLSDSTCLLRPGWPPPAPSNPLLASILMHQVSTGTTPQQLDDVQLLQLLNQSNQATALHQGVTGPPDGGVSLGELCLWHANTSGLESQSRHPQAAAAAPAEGNRRLLLHLLTQQQQRNMKPPPPVDEAGQEGLEVCRAPKTRRSDKIPFWRTLPHAGTRQYNDQLLNQEGCNHRGGVPDALHHPTQLDTSSLNADQKQSEGGKRARPPPQQGPRSPDLRLQQQQPSQRHSTETSVGGNCPIQPQNADQVLPLQLLGQESRTSLVAATIPNSLLPNPAASRNVMPSGAIQAHVGRGVPTDQLLTELLMVGGHSDLGRSFGASGLRQQLQDQQSSNNSMATQLALLQGLGVSPTSGGPYGNANWSFGQRAPATEALALPSASSLLPPASSNLSRPQNFETSEVSEAQLMAILQAHHRNTARQTEGGGI